MNHFIFAKLGKNPIYTFHPNYKSSKKVQVEVNRGKNGHESNDLFCRKKKNPFVEKRGERRWSKLYAKSNRNRLLSFYYL